MSNHVDDKNLEFHDEDALFEDAFNANNLRVTYDRRLRGTRTRGRDGVSDRHLLPEQVERLICRVSEKVLDGSYVFSPYREVLKLKGAHKPPRVISIPTLSDRLVLTVLAKYLRDLIPEIEFPRPQNLVAGIRESMRSGLYRDFMRLDIVAFYPSISHEAIQSSLEQHRIPRKAALLTLGAVRNPTLPDGPTSPLLELPRKGVPSGTAIANVVGEIVLKSLDEQLRRSPEVAYFRYVDDILILSPYGKRGELSKLVKAQLDMVELKSHARKAGAKSSTGRVGEQSFEFLGYTFERGKVTVHKSRCSRLVDNLARPITMLRRSFLEGHSNLEKIRSRAEWWLNFRITGCIAEGSRRGWLPYYSQIDQISLLHHLDDVVSKLVNRLPPQMVIHPKSFLTAYAFTRDQNRDRNQYIPNFDLVTEPEDMRRILETASDYRSLPTEPDRLAKLFRKFVGFAVKELETDVGSVS